jgi:hypothetical protein
VIISYNVCDNCSSQLEIMSGSMKSGIEVTMRIRPVYEPLVEQFSFGANKNMQIYTFCDKNCYIEFLKKGGERDSSE